MTTTTDTRPNIRLEGGNTTLIPEDRRVLYVENPTNLVKINDGSGRHHFARTTRTVLHEGRPLIVYSFVGRTANAE